MLLTYNSGVVVVGQHPLTQRHQQPKSFLLWTVEQQDGGDDVHRLQRRRNNIFRFPTHPIIRIVILTYGHKFSNHFRAEYTHSMNSAEILQILCPVVFPLFYNQYFYISLAVCWVRPDFFILLHLTVPYAGFYYI